MKSIVLAAAAGLCALMLSGAAQAQDAPGPARLKLAHDLIDAMGGSRAIAVAINPGLAGVKNPDQNAADAAQEQEERNKTIMDGLPQATEIAAAAYARLFTEKELADLVTFYRAPANKDLVTRMSPISDRSAISLIVVMNTLQRELLISACAKITCSDSNQGVYENIKPVSKNKGPPDPLLDGYDQ